MFIILILLNMNLKAQSKYCNFSNTYLPLDDKQILINKRNKKISSQDCFQQNTFINSGIKAFNISSLSLQEVLGRRNTTD